MKYPFPRPPKYLTRVKKSATGHGLFAINEIPAKKFIIEYWGKLVKDEEAEKIRITGNRVFLFSTKKIKPGEEIVYDYGKEYFNAFIKPKGCLCPPCKKKALKKALA